MICFFCYGSLPQVSNDISGIWHLICLVLYTKDTVVYVLEIEVTHIQKFSVKEPVL